MSIVQTACSSYKVELLQAIHNFNNPGGHTFKVALYGNTASLDTTTTVYTAAGEVSGTGYSAGGLALTAVSPSLSGTTAVADFLDATWTSATFTAYAALIYNSTQGNRAVCVLNFGSPYSCTNQNFTIQFPTADAVNAIVRVV